jgi:prepilin-type N-terminal cleavage/methylation domain-containing protein/prepilin-type processing-associated H-X9-DG protein
MILYVEHRADTWWPRRSAFTLVELLTVVAITAVLLALIFPAYQRVTESGRATACIAHLRQIGSALNSYLSENNLTMPELRGGRASRDEEVPVIDNTLNKYLNDPRVFACPSDPKYFAASGTSYYWNVALNGQTLGGLNFMRLVEDHSKIPIIADKEGFHPYLENKLNILYADGHATKELKFWNDNSAKSK